MAVRRQRGHLCQCAEGCHGAGPCDATIERSVYVTLRDPFSGERYPTTTPARLCGPCAERYLSAETDA